MHVILVKMKQHGMEKDELSNLDAYVTEQIEYILAEFPNRSPGSDDERAAQEYVAREAMKYADDVEIQDYKVSDKAFMGFQIPLAIFMIAGALVYWFMPIIALLLSVLGFLIFLFEFVLLKQFLEKIAFPFYKGKFSQNVIARRKPREDVKRILILNAHVDASYEFRLSMIHPALFKILVNAGVLSIFIMLGINTAATIFSILPGASWNAMRTWITGFADLWGIFCIL